MVEAATGAADLARDRVVCGVTKAEAPDRARRHRARTVATMDLMVALLLVLM